MMLLSTNSRRSVFFLISLIAIGTMLFLPSAESVLRGTTGEFIGDEHISRILNPGNGGGNGGGGNGGGGGGGNMMTDPPSTGTGTGACAGDPCGSTSNFNTCEDVGGTAVCDCEYSNQPFNDVWPICYGPAQDCNTVTFDCVDSLCYNWCDPDDATSATGCLATSNCEMLECNPNHRINGPDSRCTCPSGYEMYTIDTGSPYITAAGCAQV